MGEMLMQGSVVLFLVKATIILIGALLATMVMQRASAGSRHLVWLVTLATLLLVPVLTAWGPIQLAVLPAIAVGAERGPGEGQVRARSGPGPRSSDATSADVVRQYAQPSVGEAQPTTFQPAATGSEARSTLTSSSFVRGALTGATIAVVAWALVALTIVAVLLRDALVLRRIVRASTPLETSAWRDMLWEIADRLELPDAPRLLRSEEAKMPFACGVRRATIVLPAESDGWSVARRRAVLLHELAHVRRHDLVGHMLGRLACAVYWFHPLVWTAAKQLRAESERACDDLALGCGTQASDYAEHLLDIVTSVRHASTPTVALAMARRKEFEGRMLAILDPDVRRAAPTRWQSGGLVVSLAAMAALVGAATPARRPAQHVVFAAAMKPALPQDERSHQSGVGSDRASGDTTDVAPISNRIATGVSRRVSSDVANHVADHVAGDVADHVAASVAANVANGIAAGTPMSIGALASRAIAQVLGGTTARVSGTPGERAALLIKVLQTDSSSRVRRTAAWGLAQLVDEAGVADALATALMHDSDAGVRKDAAWGLAQASRGTVNARDALIAAVQHDADAQVRAQAAWALGNRSSSAALPALSAALHDTSARVRSQAAWAIGNIEPNSAPKALVDALRDPAVEVRSQASWALFNIHDESTAAAINAAFAREKDVRVQAREIEALGMMGDAGMASIRAALNSSDARVKSAAVNALAMGHGGIDPNPNPNPNPNP